MPTWNADLYLQFANERTQPSIDLIARIGLRDPRRIVDAGCGPGNSTEALRQRWANAEIIGLDNSEAMIAKARQSYPQAAWEVGDASHWQSDEPFDLVFSNAVWHWLPDHAKLCRHWMSQVKPGGALAVQIPAHYDSPMQREILEVSRDAAWDSRMQAARAAQTHHPPKFYYDALRPLASRVDLWETTYYHVMEGPQAIIEWFRGTGLRPFLEALSSDEERARFEALLLDRYREAYPRQTTGEVLFPFRRLFFIARR